MLLSDVPFRFGLAVFDEAHMLRSPRRGIPRAAMLVSARRSVLITATPTLNRIEDFVGLALHVWRWQASTTSASLPMPPILRQEMKVTRNDLSGSQAVIKEDLIFTEQGSSVGSVEGQHYDNSGDDALTNLSDSDNDRPTSPGRQDVEDTPAEETGSVNLATNWQYVLDKFAMADIPRMADASLPCPIDSLEWEELGGDDDEQAVADNNALLHPPALRSIKGEPSQRSGDLSQVFRRVHRMLTVRCSMNQAIRLPNATVAFPREEMPPIQMQYVVCRYLHTQKSGLPILTLPSHKDSLIEIPSRDERPAPVMLSLDSENEEPAATPSRRPETRRPRREGSARLPIILLASESDLE
ncbi:hypothetical protein VTK56DRAFT_5979 [Thermocarpiscus australiensis]